MTEKKGVERRWFQPFPLNSVERSGFRRRALCVLTLLALAEARSVHAACVPTGTSQGDAIVCSGSQTEGVAAKSGNDSISILPGASISLTTPQSTTAVDAGSGNDTVVNDGSISVTVTPPAVAAAGKSAACSGYRDDSYDKSTVQGTGIAGGGGNDLINNRGTIAVQTAAAGGTQSPQCDSSHSDNKHDADDGHRPVKPAAVSIGVLGDNGNDQINNSGAIAVSASSDANSPQVTAKGIVGANGDDVIVNSGTITVAASSVAAPSVAAPSAQDSAPALPLSNRSHGSKRQDISETGSVTAVGIEGGNGKDILRNDGALTVNASATASSNTRSLTLTGGDEVTATTTLETRAVGITGGAGKDEISNSGVLTANATSEVNDVDVKASLLDRAHSDTSTFVRSSAAGIDAGSGKDSIIVANAGTIAVNATSKSSGVSVNLSLVAAATGESKLEVQSTATGISGGQSKNTIDIGGTVKTAATSQVTDVGVSVNYAELTILDRQGSDASTQVESKATGIDGSKGENRVNIAATGSVEAIATSTVRSISVGVGMEGVPQNTETLINDRSLASIGIASNSAATGIVGGGHGDYLANAGRVAASAASSATQNNVNIGISLFEISIPTPNIGLAGAGTAANAIATGILSGGGDDTILNSGLVKSDADADATARAFAISLGVVSVDLIPGAPTIPLGATLIVADTATTASAQSTGVAGGAGDDIIRNTSTGTVQTQASASAVSLAVSGSANIEYEDGEKLFTVDAVAARAGTAATSQAAGIDGGAGANQIYNDGSVTVGAASNATAVAVAVNVAGTLKGSGAILGLSATDTSSTATADATGIRGSSDHDRISNTGSVAVTSNADVTSASASLAATIAKKGLVAGVGLARAESIATASATGIDGAGGRDDIENTGTIAATAKASADAIGVSVAVEGTKQGVAAGAALTDTSTTATATAVGIRGGGAGVTDDRDRDDKDRYYKDGDSKDGRISNANAINANAQAQTLSVSASVNAAIAKGGLVVGVGLARAESIASASATGIDGAGGQVEIENTGTITAKATADADAVGVSLSVAGTKQGVAGGAALTDTSTTATATATGIRGGGAAKEDDRDRHDEDRNYKHDDGKDGRITNANAISADAQAQALSVGASVAAAIAKEGLVVGVGLARAESNATATAIGIDGGGTGEIENTGTIAAKATAGADAIGVSLAVAGTKQGVAGSAALTDTSTAATATAIGIRGGTAARDGDRDRHDLAQDEDRHREPGDIKARRITSTRVVSANAEAHALSVGISANISVAKDGVVLGAALADTSTRAEATAKGIEAGDGDYEISNEGKMAVKTDASGQAVSVALTVEGTARGLAAGAALVDASVNATSAATGVEGASGNDRITNRGDMSVDAKSTATAVGVAAGFLAAKEGAALGAALADTSATASAVATGLAGGSGNDVLVNQGSITTQNVNAGADAVTVSLEVALAKEGVGAGAALAKSDSTSRAGATGLDGGAGNDELVNEDLITLDRVTAGTNAVSVSLAVAGVKDGVALGAALVDADATAAANATGMAGGAGDDKLTNLGTIVAKDIRADATAVGVSLSATFSQNGAVVAAALAQTGTTAEATAKGLDGGAGEDSLTNSGSVTLQQVKADAGAVSVSVGLSGAEAGVTIAAGLADASGKAFAAATGMDGGTDDDTLVNSDKGKVTVQDIGASGHAAGISVALSGSSVGLSAGAALADTSGTATTTAKGLDGGAGNDTLLNYGEIAVKRTTADADSTSVSVSISASLSAGVAAGAALSRAGATANATATGMDGGAGYDQMLNRGSITVDGVTANANAASVSAQLGVTNAGVAIGAALADTRSSATATAKGMDGGTGDDWLKNEGQITLQNLKADAGAVSVSATLNGAITGGVAAGVALADGRVTAETTATGMDGGAGRDVLYNTGTIKVQGVESNAHATGVSVTANVSMAGLAGGAALSNTSATARTVAKGMDGGTGDDKIVNTGAIDIQGKSKAESASVSVNFSVALGVALGAELSKANTISETTVIGIDAGGGRDEIANAGTIDVQADAQSKAAAVSVGISVGVGGDATLAEAKASATATAVGINQVDNATNSSMPYGSGYGDHDDRDGTNVIENKGAVSAIATSKSTGTSISVDLHGLAMGDTTNTSTAEAIGIRTGDGKDQILNQGAITATSDATATGLSVSVTGGGKAMGDASTTAQAGATGIQTGGGNDEITNLETINASARSSASAITVSVGLAGVSEANASTRSLAMATGIDGGSGKDTIVNRASVTASAGDAAAAAGADCTAAGGACAATSTVSVTLAGTGAVDATTTARSTATGIAGGADDDTIYSDGTINASSRAKTTASGVNVGIFGATQSSLDTTATASATGVSGGDGDDVIETHSTIKAASASHIVTSGRGFTVGGSGGFDATLSATAIATAIDGGAGKDSIHNEAALTVSATSTLSASGGSTVVFGSSGAGATSGAFTDAVGIRAGAGDDQVWNGGAIDARSAANLSLDSSSFSFAGGGGADGRLTASTRSVGITGDAGADTIHNEAAIVVDAKSTLSSSGRSTTVFGTSSGGGSSGASTAAIGIDGGDQDDTLSNKAAIVAGSTATLTLSNSSFTFGGTGGTSGSLTASTQSTGIAGGKGRDSIMNEGELNVSATSSLASFGGSNVAFGASGAGANSGAVTTAVGIDGGEGDDVIVNKGRVTATSSASLSMDNSSFSFGGTGGTSGSLTASTQSAGIAGGKGRDGITNEGELNVGASSSLNSSGDSSVAFGASGAGANSGAVTTAVGIDGGDDDDSILNKGRVTATSDATLRMDNSSFSFGGSGDTSGTLTASTRSVGIQGGDGNDAIQNDGDILVRANSDLQNSGHVSNDLGGGTSASGEVVATLSARGIDGGAGNDWIANNGTIDVKAAASANSTHSSSSGFFFGGGTSIAQARADITAIGIDASQGNNTVLNTKNIAVELSGTASTQTSADGSTLGFDGDAFGLSQSALSATAVGIAAGDGANQITNTGSIDVKTWRLFEFLGLVLPLPVQAVAGGHAEGHGFKSATEFTNAQTSVFAAGISAGNGANTIRNEGSIDVDLRASANASASSDAGGAGIGDGESHADSAIFARAIGIAVGNGANQITNTGSIKVGTSLFASGDSSAVGHLTGDADSLSTAKINAFAAGINAGNGANTIRNEGTLDVALSATARTSTNSDAGSTGSNFDFAEARVSAQGYGIHTGSGNNTIVNKGTINVTVTASNNTGFGHITAGATGIETGSGNDTIINEGTITATTIVNGVTLPGTAIRAGAGDDLVKLTSGSVTNGTIDLGTGNNRLMLEGTPVINGTILDGSGSLALAFNAAGAFNGALPGVSAVKNGPGTFTLSMLNKMQRIEVNQGTLKLDSDYTFMGNGMFQAKVGGGSYGQFYVNGWAALDGTMKIVRGGGAYVNGAAFDVLTASNGIQPGTAFSRVELPADTRLLKFHTEQLPDSVVVKADVASFTTVAGTPNQMAVARNLDRILPRTSGQLNQLLGNIQVLPEAQFASAFAGMSPAAYANYSTGTFNSAQQYANVLQDRMTALRESEFSPVRNADVLGGPIRLAYTGGALSDLLGAREAERALSSGLWLRGFSQKGDQNADDSFSRFDYRLAGTTIGYDQRFTRSLAGGLSLGTVRNKVTADMSEGDVDSTLGSIYAGYFDRRVYVTGALSAGRNKYDTRRNTGTVSSSHGGDLLSAALGAGHYAQLGASLLEPFASLQYTRLKEEGFSETGTGAMSLPARASGGLVSTVGARFSQLIGDGNGASWTPQASLAWLHDYADRQVISASYVGAPDSSFSVEGLPIERNGALLGLGLSYRTKSGFTTTLLYNGEFRERYRAHGFIGELRFEY